MHGYQNYQNNPNRFWIAKALIRFFPIMKKVKKKKLNS